MTAGHWMVFEVLKLGKETVLLKPPAAWVDFSSTLGLVMVVRNPSGGGLWQAVMAGATLKLRPYFDSVHGNGV